MEQEINPYAGITFHPAAERYSVSVAKQTIGAFKSLEAAVAARDRYLAYHMAKNAISYATAHSFRETRKHA